MADVKTVKSHQPKFEQWRVSADHSGAENQHSHSDYSYEKVGDGPVVAKRISIAVAENDNQHSHNSKLRWYLVEDPEEMTNEEAKALAEYKGEATGQPAMEVKEKQPKQPKPKK